MVSNALAGQVGGEFAKIIWDGHDKLIKSLKAGPETVTREVMTILEREAPRIESEMRVTAPWTDQTGNARNGLAARAFRSGEEMGIVLYHQVPYGIWLELANDSRFAIIIPTLASETPVVMGKLSDLMSKMRF